jgi:hypothetical protein
LKGACARDSVLDGLLHASLRGRRPGRGDYRRGVGHHFRRRLCFGCCFRFALKLLLRDPRFEGFYRASCRGEVEGELLARDRFVREMETAREVVHVLKTHEAVGDRGTVLDRAREHEKMVEDRVSGYLLQ